MTNLYSFNHNDNAVLQQASRRLATTELAWVHWEE